MSLMTNEYRDRLKHWIRTLKLDLYRPLGEIPFEAYTTMDYLTPEQAARGDFRPLAVGTEWGHTWEYLWARATLTLPEAAKGHCIVMSLDLGGETTLFVDGQAFGTRRAEWVRTPHHYISDNILTESAQGGETFDLLFEAYAGHYFPGEATGPVLPGTCQDPKTEGKRARVGTSTYGIWNEDAYQLLMDVETLRQVMECLPETSLRAAKIADGLEAFTRCVDFEQDEAGRDADYRKARRLLSPLLKAKNGSTMPQFTAIGNSHLDLAWLWPMQETERKTARTFAQQLRLLEKYPDYRYIQSQPASYVMCREHYPELYARIREAIRQGRWIADGAMYVEPDTNMSSGEALIRQVMHGKRFYRDELGVESKVLWLPDTFGYTAALPQILKGFGVNYLVTQKIFWSYNDSDRFPYHYFTWRGMDGTDVTAFLPTSYTYDTKPEEVDKTWKVRVQQRDLEGFLYPFGYGDGGGGPTRDHIEYALRLKDLEGMPRMKMAGPLEFFEEMEREHGKPVNTWDGELYFPCHRGTYTSQARVKRNNRRTEWALHDAEVWGMAALLKGAAYPMEAMDRLWKEALLHQFHDILPGSSIGRVYEEANARHARLQQEAAALTQKAQSILTKGEGLTVFNSLGFARQALVELPEGCTGLKDAAGTPVPAMDGRALVDVPALGAASFMPCTETADADLCTARLTAEGAVLENEQVIVRLNSLGEVVSFIRRDSGREFVEGTMNRLTLYKDVPRKFDAWDIDSNYVQQPVPVEENAELVLVRGEGLTASVRVTRSFSASTLTQEIRLTSGSARLDFDTTIDWHEEHRLLKACFSGTPRALEAEHEMQFGFVKRPTHQSRMYDKDRFEVCNHRYTAIHDASHGFAVLNDCKYGVSADGATIGLTLMRASMAPEFHADQGEHHMTYALYAWDGAFADCGVVEQGLDLNQPVSVLPGSLEAFSLASVDKDNIIIDTVKPAEDGSGDMILRLYEAMNADTGFTLTLGTPITSAAQVDLMEENPRPLTADG